MEQPKKFGLLAFELILIAILVLIIAYDCYGEPLLYVTATQLNGRAEPNKSSRVEAIFERGEAVEPTGQTHGDWIEVVGGETGTVWCSMDYLSETDEAFHCVNTSGGRVRVRSCPDGKPCGWIAADQTVTISRVVNGWGYVEHKGWVSLSFFSKGE